MKRRTSQYTEPMLHANTKLSSTVISFSLRLALNRQPSHWNDDNHIYVLLEGSHAALLISSNDLPTTISPRTISSLNSLNHVAHTNSENEKHTHRCGKIADKISFNSIISMRHDFRNRIILLRNADILHVAPIFLSSSFSNQPPPPHPLTMD